LSEKILCKKLRLRNIPHGQKEDSRNSKNPRIQQINKLARKVIRKKILNSEIVEELTIHKTFGGFCFVVVISGEHVFIFYQELATWVWLICAELR
jgi:hypothetical protein